MKNNHDNDMVLLKLVREDDEIAFKEIFNKYSEGMYNFALNVLKDRVACQDIVQQIFIDLWTRRKTANIKKLKPYLYQSVKFQVFKEIRGRITQEHVVLINLVDSSSDIIKQLEYQELEKLIQIKIKELAPRCQQIFIMSKFSHKSNKEIAQELEISIQAVKNQIGKARQFLRKELEHLNIII